MKATNVKYKITNHIVFAVVMHDKNICREFLELVLPGRKIRDIRFPGGDCTDVEKTIIAGISSKSVRLDVLFEEDDGWYDIEMQVEREKHLPQRVRYYQSMIDTHDLKAGKDYSQLRASYIIFICLYDPFLKDEPYYEIESFDKKSFLPFNDGRFTILLNIPCSVGKIPDDLKPFYAYIKTGAVAENSLVEQIHSKVKTVNDSEELVSIMTLEEELKHLERRVQLTAAELEKSQAAVEKAQADMEKARADMEKAHADVEKARADAKKAQAETKQEIARSMKMKGLDPALIAEMTGIGLPEIENLK